MSGKRSVCVIGAGASGLPSIRHALLYGFDVTCFEGSDGVAGLWRYKPQDTDESSVMKTTVINTSKEMTAYSDFPPTGEAANFMHNTQMRKYLEDYTKHFNLYDNIKFNHKVVNVERAASYSNDGRWTVTYTDNTGSQQSGTFDAVMCCTGHHARPHYPQPWRGQDGYKGRISHSHDYKDHRGFEDKTVVVVGIGNSGCDIAVELSRIAKQVYLVTRRGAWIFNRIYDYGEPFDLALSTRANFGAMNVVPEWMSNTFVEWKLNKRFDHAKYGLKPKHRVFGAHPSVNDELPNRIACGTVLVKPNISQFIGDNTLEFEDGSRVEGVDEVILSTGFSFDFPLLEKGKLIEVKDNEVSLYKYMLPTKTADKNTLTVVGLIQPFGSIMPMAELQARVFLDQLAGNSKLPSKGEMEADVKLKKDMLNARYVHSRRHTLQVDYVPYMDELADLIDCKPHMKELVLSDPVLAFQAFFGPNVPYCYRLRGPHRWAGARQAIMQVRQRVMKATNAQSGCTGASVFPEWLVLIILATVVLGMLIKLLF